MNTSTGGGGGLNRSMNTPGGGLNRSMNQGDVTALTPSFMTGVGSKSFEALDVNGDGVIDRSEWDSIQQQQQQQQQQQRARTPDLQRKMIHSPPRVRVRQTSPISSRLIITSEILELLKS